MNESALFVEFLQYSCLTSKSPLCVNRLGNQIRQECKYLNVKFSLISYKFKLYRQNQSDNFFYCSADTFILTQRSSGQKDLYQYYYWL